MFRHRMIATHFHVGYAAEYPKPSETKADYMPGARIVYAALSVILLQGGGGSRVNASWMHYLRRGFSRRFHRDRIARGADCDGSGKKLSNLYPVARRHWKQGLLGILLVGIASLLGLPQPLITRYIVDTVILESRPRLLFGAVILLVVVALSEKLLSSLQRFYFARIEQRVILDIENRLLNHSLRLPKSFFDRNETGYLMSRLSSDTQGLRWFFSGTVVAIPSNLLRLLGGLAALLYLEWRLALAIFIIAPIFLLAIRWFSARLHALSHRSMEQNASICSRLQESLSAMSLIKAFSAEARTIRRLTTELKAALHISLEQAAVDSFASLIIGTLPGIAKTVVLGLGAYWVIGGHWTLGSLLAFLAYLGYVFGPAQFLASTNLQLQGARAALERISGLFEIVPEENLGVGKVVTRLSGDIEFENVCFSYDGINPVLEDISFRAAPGECVAVVGPSGVGKTTLLNLILRFYKPTAGEVRFDGRSASEYEVGSLRRRIGYVAQSTMLLSGTVLENLRYGNPDATEEQVRRAAQLADIHDFIENLPAGYDSVIGERGINLSEGQMQRLSLARALVRDPDILVFDEPTSAVDGLCEQSICESLPAAVRQRTLFVVTHSLATARESDRILLLNENRLVAVGSHASFLESNGYYRSLLGCQPTHPAYETPRSNAGADITPAPSSQVH
jgi:ABC-type bacteriocin/lantibiotic exporter with double-glycine peptidase domain